MKRSVVAVMWAAFGSQLVGCAVNGTGVNGNDDVQIALSMVPVGIQCVRVTVTTGGSTVTSAVRPSRLG